MTYRKEIVCLANSRRVCNRCVAGLELTEEGFGEWVRPVSKNSSEGEVTELERQYENGEEPKLLDVMDIEFSQPKPDGHQQENHIISNERWKLKKRLSWDDIQKAVQCPRKLWTNDYFGHSRGKNDRVSRKQLAQQDGSLYLIRPDNLKIIVEWDQYKWKKRKKGSKEGYRIQADFRFHGVGYCLVVTDVEAENRYKTEYQTSGSPIHIRDALLCVSLAEPRKNDQGRPDEFAFKLVAAVITPDIMMD